MTSRLAALVGAALIAGTTLELVRRRSLREKYAVLWITISGLLITFAVFPGALGAISSALGFELPANLVFAVGCGLLLLVSMQLSLELGRQEERARILSEELAIQSHELGEIRRRLAALDGEQAGLVRVADAEGTPPVG